MRDMFPRPQSQSQHLSHATKYYMVRKAHFSQLRAEGFQDLWKVSFELAPRRVFGVHVFGHQTSYVLSTVKGVSSLQF
jgi:hypothetical protein